jgi:hypothetical protein
MDAFDDLQVEEIQFFDFIENDDLFDEEEVEKKFFETYLNSNTDL